MAKYSILTFNFNNYEIMREPDIVDPDCDYIYVTDNPQLHSNKWNIIYDTKLLNLSPFDKCFYVRYNLFNYATTPICICIDGSMHIHKSLSKLYNAFINSQADIGLTIHPDRETVAKEYPIWVERRNYPAYQVTKANLMFKAANWNPSSKQLYQTGMRICKNTSLNSTIDTYTLQVLKKLGNNNIIDRLDQTIYTFILSKFFPTLKVFPFSQQVFQSEYITLCKHGTTTPYNIGTHPYWDNGYVLGKITPLYKL